MVFISSERKFIFWISENPIRVTHKVVGFKLLPVSKSAHSSVTIELTQKELNFCDSRSK
jgi:hypothetical protein